MAIKAKTIKADNIVEGVQAVGVEGPDLEGILKLVRGRLNGSIEADTIEARNLVEGLQWIAPGAVPDLPALRSKMAELEDEILRAPDPEVAKAGEALTEARQELEAPDPDRTQVEKKLERAAKILAGLSRVGETAEKLGGQLTRWTVGAAGLWEIAQRILGG